jgi:thioredoxin 1
MIQTIVGEDDFQKNVLQSKVPVLVDFWATWCAPCLAAAPIMEALANEYDGKINFARVNVEDNGSLAGRYGIAAIPTMLIFNGGQPVQQVIGYRPKKQFKEALDDILGE